MSVIEHARKPSAGQARQQNEPDLESLRRRLVRFACDIHDGPMQHLVAAGFGIRVVQSELAHALSEHPRAVTALEELFSELAAAEDQLRELITSLENTDATIHMLDDIVATAVGSFATRSKAALTVDIPLDFQPDSHSQAVAIKWILHEALTNIAKHAHATTVDLKISVDTAGVQIDLTDDGIGFDKNRVGANSIGLSSMQQRVELLAGRFEATSKIGGPTAISAHLPRWNRQTTAPRT
jgi:signal transduction histidine kinase